MHLEVLQMVFLGNLGCLYSNKWTLITFAQTLQNGVYIAINGQYF